MIIAQNDNVYVDLLIPKNVEMSIIVHNVAIKAKAWTNNYCAK